MTNSISKGFTRKGRPRTKAGAESDLPKKRYDIFISMVEHESSRKVQHLKIQ